MGRTCSTHVQLMFWACSFHDNSMNNLLLYCVLVDARISASEKDITVQMKLNHMLSYLQNYFSILGTTLVYATEFGKEGNCTNFVNISLLPWTKETADCCIFALGCDN